MVNQASNALVFSRPARPVYARAAPRPRGWAAEDGESPWLADYGLRESLADDEPSRIRANVRDAHATLWLGHTGSPQHAGVLIEVGKLDRPFLLVQPGTTGDNRSPGGSLAAQLPSRIRKPPDSQI